MLDDGFYNLSKNKNSDHDVDNDFESNDNQANWMDDDDYCSKLQMLLLLQYNLINT